MSRPVHAIRIAASAVAGISARVWRKPVERQDYACRCQRQANKDGNDDCPRPGAYQISCSLAKDISNRSGCAQQRQSDQHTAEANPLHGNGRQAFQADQRQKLKTEKSNRKNPKIRGARCSSDSQNVWRLTLITPTVKTSQKPIIIAMAIS